MTEKSSSGNLGAPIALFLAGVVIALAILVSGSFGDKNEEQKEREETLVLEETQDKNTEDTGETLGETLEEDNDFKTLEDDDPFKGDKNASVVIVEFSEYQCPYCKIYVDDAYKQILSEYIETGKAKYVFRDFPLPNHLNAQKAAEAAECADDQGKFWEYHDTLFEEQKTWSSLVDPTNEFVSYAENFGLDKEIFRSCLVNGDKEAEVKNDYNVAITEIIRYQKENNLQEGAGTPSFFINGKLLVGAQPFSAFKQVIETQLNK